MTDEMTVERAKERLRATAAEHPLFGWVKRHPKESLVGALVLGLTVGRYPRLGSALRRGAFFALKTL